MTLDDLLEAEVLFYFVSVYEGDPHRPRQMQFPVAERNAFTRYVEKALRLPTTYSVSVIVGTEECVYPWGDFTRQTVHDPYFTADADDVRHCLPVPTRAPLVVSGAPQFIFVNCPEIEEEFKDDAEYMRLLEAHVLSLADDPTGEDTGTMRTPLLEQTANAIARKLLDDARKDP